MRTPPALSRRLINFGESLSYTAPTGAATYQTWTKHTADGTAPRWQQSAGNAASVPFTVDWATLLTLFDGFDPEVYQITAHDSDGNVIARDLYRIPAPNSVDAATIAAQERRYLETLVSYITDKDTTNQLVQHTISTPDGTSLERMNIAMIEKRISETRARIAWFEQAAVGNALPRMETW